MIQGQGAQLIEAQNQRLHGQCMVRVVNHLRAHTRAQHPEVQAIAGIHRDMNVVLHHQATSAVHREAAVLTRLRREVAPLIPNLTEAVIAEEILSIPLLREAVRPVLTLRLRGRQATPVHRVLPVVVEAVADVDNIS